MARSRKYSPPFRDLTGSEVTLGAWHLKTDGGEPLRLDSEIPGWDYLRKVELCRQVTVDGTKVAATCDLPDSAAFALVVTAHSTSSRFREVVFRSPEIARCSTDIYIEFSLDSSQLSREVRLDTEVLLVASPPARSPFVATRPGSRLYMESSHIDLEGSGSRLPIELADLGGEIPGLAAPGAAWHVLLETTDLHAPTMRSLRVLLNRQEQRVVEAAQSGDVVLLSLLSADVARRILSLAISDDEFQTNPDDFEEGTTGEAARRLMKLCFPGLSPASVLAIAVSSPARYESVIQSCTRIGDA